MTSVRTAETQAPGARATTTLHGNPGHAGARPAGALRAVVLPGDALLNPIALVALGLLLLNDHVLKAAWPGAVTGKLSDLAGLVFFPLLLMSAAELTLAAVSRWRGPSIRTLTLAIGFAGFGFALSKTVPAITEASEWLFGLAQWALSLPVRLAAGLPISPVAPTTLVPDPTDLVALPCLVIAFLIGIVRVQNAERVDRQATTARELGP